jgi:hypothetical protein
LDKGAVTLDRIKQEAQALAAFVDRCRSTSILTSAYFILRDGVAYRDLGPDYLDRRDPAKIARRLAKRIEALGFSVDLRPAA